MENSDNNECPSSIDPDHVGDTTMARGPSFQGTTESVAVRSSVARLTKSP